MSLQAGIILTVVVALCFVAAALIVLISWLKRRPEWRFEGFRGRGALQPRSRRVLAKARAWGEANLKPNGLSQLMLIRIACVPPNRIPKYNGKEAAETGKTELVGFQTPYTIFVPTTEDQPDLLAHAFGWHILKGLAMGGFDQAHSDNSRQQLQDDLAGLKV